MTVSHDSTFVPRQTTRLRTKFDDWLLLTTDPGQLLIAGAGLDVTEEEPLPQPSALWSLPNVVLTPHCAPHTPDFAVGSAQVFMRNLERYCAEAEAGLENVVGVDKGY